MKASITELPRLNSATPSPIFDASSTLIRMPEVERIVGMKRSTIYKLMQRTDSDFPQPVKLSNSNARGAPVAWVLSEVQAWTLGRIEARDQVAA
ncbi:AlpA family phage regulatory protein [Pseudomonas sp. MAFF 730085]|uniref:AlpA family phage regulatory protein n=1 Tax=Pseudomonas kitaguniensis TaxID=2607908 RepID=A0A5N7JRH5_9PSED|nr:AlpA family phage regulatory protein [Pseudomonas kitaguniensis]MPQ83990.1 AlpA family phage regulatory protein [Pseudomonas kitaguniensis]